MIDKRTNRWVLRACILFFGIICGFAFQLFKAYTRIDDVWNIRLPIALVLGIFSFSIFNYVSAHIIKLFTRHYDIKIQVEDMKTYVPLCLILIIPIQERYLAPEWTLYLLPKLLILFALTVFAMKILLVYRIKKGKITLDADDEQAVACKGWIPVACLFMGIPLFWFHQFTVAFDDYYGSSHAAAIDTPYIYHNSEMRRAIYYQGRIKMSLQVPYEHSKIVLSHTVLETPKNIADDQVPLEFKVSARDAQGKSLFEESTIQYADKASRGWYDMQDELQGGKDAEIQLTMTTKPVIHKMQWDYLLKFIAHNPLDVEYFRGLSARSAWSQPAVVSMKNKRPKVILISIDTLRADALGCYGNPRDVSPTIDSFARNNIMFQNAFSQCSSTLPSHFSMLTGRFPNELADDIAKRKMSSTVLADYLTGQGYYCAAFTGGGFVSPLFGFYKGFHIYNANTRWEGGWGKERSFELAREWISKNTQTDFFLFLHTFMVHDYIFKADLLPKNNSKKDQDRIHLSFKDLFPEGGSIEEFLKIPRRRRLKDSYDFRIRLLDSYLRDFFDFLKENDIYDNALIIITSDHGESFGERHRNGKYRLIGHGRIPYDAQIRVPLIVKLPSPMTGAPVVVGEDVRVLDIAPSILAVLGDDVVPEFHGRNILPGFSYAGTGRYTFAYATTRDGSWECLRKDQKKYLRHMSGREEYYDLAADPKESTNIAPLQPEGLAELRDTYTAFKSETGEGLASAPDPVQDIPEHLRRDLKALGYLN